MSMPLKQIEAEALQLPRAELDALIAKLQNHRDNLDGAESPEAVAAAWNAEIARRLDEIDHGAVEWIPGEEAFARIDTLLRGADA
jgi:hypothetical protein